MAKKVNQKKSETKVKTAKTKALRAAAAPKAATLKTKAAPAKAVATAKAVASAKAASASEKASSAVSIEASSAKPAISGREAARLALVQKAATSKWAQLNSKANKIPVAPYNLKNQYEIETAINHKTLGWGYIQDKKNDRLEVLFENGIKYLISNYK